MTAALLKRIPTKAVTRIGTGAQKYLFLRAKPRREFKRVILFTAQPEPVAVIEFIAGDIHCHTCAEMSALFYRLSAMNYNEWNAFWRGASLGYAIEIITPVCIPHTLQYDPCVYFRLKRIPEKFVYVPAPGWPLGRPATTSLTKTNMLF